MYNIIPARFVARRQGRTNCFSSLDKPTRVHRHDDAQFVLLFLRPPKTYQYYIR